MTQGKVHVSILHSKKPQKIEDPNCKIQGGSLQVLWLNKNYVLLLISKCHARKITDDSHYVFKCMGLRTN